MVDGFFSFANFILLFYCKRIIHFFFTTVPECALKLEKFPRIELKKFLSQIYTLKIKMTTIDLNVLSKEVNIHLYPYD